VASRDLRTRLQKRAAKAGVFLSADLSEQLAAYYELLARWNLKINLTATTDIDEAIDRLLLEPVAAAKYLPSSGGLMDVGSGGGSPAIPLHLAAPKLPLTMVEVKARKAAFLREAVRALGIAALVETARYEELLARPELHEAFAAVSVRAVRIEARVLKTLQAFLAPGGALLLFRGPAGPDHPNLLVPALEWMGTYPLLESLQSRLSLVRKRT
jgi:16S rRNA (guanine527-N7)-methyltransferase